jgi:hypothetical protein
MFTGFQNLVRYTQNYCCRDSLPLQRLQGLQQVTLFIKKMMGSRSSISMHFASFAHYKNKIVNLQVACLDEHLTFIRFIHI